MVIAAPAATDEVKKFLRFMPMVRLLNPLFQSLPLESAAGEDTLRLLHYS
jgi:hypothetical protein